MEDTSTHLLRVVKFPRQQMDGDTVRLCLTQESISNSDPSLSSVSKLCPGLILSALSPGHSGPSEQHSN